MVVFKTRDEERAERKARIAAREAKVNRPMSNRDLKLYQIYYTSRGVDENPSGFFFLDRGLAEAMVLSMNTETLWSINNDPDEEAEEKMQEILENNILYDAGQRAKKMKELVLGQETLKSIEFKYDGIAYIEEEELTHE